MPPKPQPPPLKGLGKVSLLKKQPLSAKSTPVTQSDGSSESPSPPSSTQKGDKQKFPRPKQPLPGLPRTVLRKQPSEEAIMSPPLSADEEEHAAGVFRSPGALEGTLGELDEEDEEKAINRAIALSLREEEQTGGPGPAAVSLSPARGWKPVPSHPPRANRELSRQSGTVAQGSEELPVSIQETRYDEWQQHELKPNEPSSSVESFDTKRELREASSIDTPTERRFETLASGTAVPKAKQPGMIHGETRSIAGVRKGPSSITPPARSVGAGIDDNRAPTQARTPVPKFPSSSPPAPQTSEPAPQPEEPRVADAASVRLSAAPAETHEDHKPGLPADLPWSYIHSPCYQYDESCLWGVSTPYFARPLPPLSPYGTLPPSPYCVVGDVAVSPHGRGSYRREYEVPCPAAGDQYHPDLMHVNYSYGEAYPGQRVRVIEEKEACGGLCRWDEVRTGYIVGYNFPQPHLFPSPPRFPTTKDRAYWRPVLLFYQSHE